MRIAGLSAGAGFIFILLVSKLKITSEEPTVSLPNEKMVQKNYNVRTSAGHVPIKLWNKHVTIEEAALKQLDEVASMPFVKPYVAAMPDTHWGMGATVGSVIPTVGAVMPAAVGVDIGCGMMAVRTNIQIDSGDENNLPSHYIP